MEPIKLVRIANAIKVRYLKVSYKITSNVVLQHIASLNTLYTSVKATLDVETITPRNNLLVFRDLSYSYRLIYKIPNHLVYERGINLA